MEYGTLRVHTPDGQVREYPIEVPTVVVGRAEGNGVVIDHVTVSRRHAQLRIEDGRLIVEDLGSATGTYVAGQRIPGNTPNLVEDGQQLRFGDAEAIFLVPVAAVAQSTLDPAGRSPNTASATDSQATVAVSLTSPSAPVAAGATTTATVVIQNRGNVVDQLTISVPDIPAAWVRLSRQQLSLVPGGRDEVTVVIQPPRTSEAVAGEYPFSVSVLSREYNREVRVLGKFVVLPFEAFAVALQPTRSTGSFRLQAENGGNALANFQLAGRDEEAALTYKFQKETLQLPPGAQEVVPIEVATRKRKLFGKVQALPFRIDAQPLGGGVQRAAADGQLAVRPPLRFWKWPVVAILVLAALGGGYWGYRQNCSGNLPLCSNDSAGGAGTPAPSGAATQPSGGGAALPAVLRNGVTAAVQNSPQNDCLLVREFYTRRPDDPRSRVLGRLCNGDKVRVVSDSVESEGFIWWTVDNGQGLRGWAAEKATSGGDIFLVLSE